MTKAEIDKVISQAKSWLGYNEADGSYRQIIDAYNAIGNGIPMDYSWPWCCCFVSAVYFKALGEKRFAEISCDRQINILKQLGVYSLTGKPEVGDLIYYDWNSDGATDHVGIVAEISGNVWTIIEGNKSDAVSYRTISPSYAYIRGFGFVTKLFERDEEEKPKAEPASSTVGQQMADKLSQTVSLTVHRQILEQDPNKYSDEVKRMQTLLIMKGYSVGRDGADGYFGSNTYLGLYKMQRDHAKITGICDKDSWIYLEG